jgi:polysaccharide pyruvyl transferase WcaK-like protein
MDAPLERCLPGSSMLPPLRRGERALIVAASGTGNAGDEAMLAGLLNIIGGEAEVTVTSRDPGLTKRLHAVRAVGLRHAAKALSEASTVVIGGGALFSKDMGTAGRLIPAFGLAALALGKRVALCGVSLDAEPPGPNRLLLRALARRAKLVVVRDAASAAILERWRVRGVKVAPDLSRWAAAATPSTGSARLLGAGLDLSRPIVGLCLNAVNPRWDVFLKRDIPELLASLPGVQFCFVPMSRHPRVKRHDDEALGQWLRRRAPGIAVLEAPADPATAIALFAHFSAAVCMRYHSLEFADRARIPVIGVPYALKCAVWTEERGMAVARPGDGSLLRLVLQALESRGALPCGT